MEIITSGRQYRDHHFSPDQYVITPIRRAVQNRQDVLIAVNEAGAVVVRGGHGEYCAEPGGFDPVKFCKAPVEQIRVTVLEPVDTGRRADSPSRRNVDELLWLAGFHASEGRLMEGCSSCDIVEIERWPNLTRLPHTPNTMRIIAMLVRHPTTIGVARKALKIEPAEINQVYSAARCAGIAHVINTTVEEPVLRPHRNQTLLSQLMARIACL